MKQNTFKRKVAVTVTLIAMFVFIVSISTVYTQIEIIKGRACSCTIPIYLIIPLLATFGFAVGSLIYYLMLGEIKTERADFKRGAYSFLKILEPNEQKVIKLLIERGSTTQAKLSKFIGLNRVQLHRVLRKLEVRGAIFKKQLKKTNLIDLSPEIKNVFK